MTMDSSGAREAGSAAGRSEGGSLDERAGLAGPESARDARAELIDAGPDPSPFGAGVDGSGGAAAPPRRKSPRRRRRPQASDREPSEASREADDARKADEPPPEEAPSRGSSDGGDGGAPSRGRRRGRRGGRGRKSAKQVSGEAPPEERAPEDEAAQDSGGEEAPAKSRRRRGRRRSGKRSEEAGEPAEPKDERDDADDDEAEGGEEGGAKRRRRGTRGGRRRKKRSQPVEIEAIPGEEDELPELPEDERDDEDSPEDSGGKRSKKRQKKAKKEKAPEGKSSRRGKKATKSAVEAEAEVVRDQVLLVNASDPEETRVALVSDGRIQDLQMNVYRHRSFVNDIYRGRVVNLETAIGAAFVDFGQGRNGFLHTSDVMAAYGDDDWSLDKLLTTQVADEELEAGDAIDLDDEEAEAAASSSKKKAKRGRDKGGRSHRRRPRQPIGELLKKGEPVVVQVTKDAIGDKGPTLTTYISIPGRYLVLMPSLARTGVSRKIEDDKERRRLKRILQSMDIPEGMGVIVRTAGVGKTKTDLRRDLEYLLIAWEAFSKRLVVGRAPMPLYEESDVAIRTMRDLFSSRTDKVYVDDKGVFDRMVEFTKILMPEHVERIELHEGARPLFHAHGVEQDFERIFARRLELPSGGSIVIDQTEALVAIDVNSGRTRDEGADFEDIALKTNLEAVPEIARQMRLRDLGGIIVLDFIDMARMSSRRQVERVLRDALAEDRARSKIGRISQFGLLELTRQRLGPGMATLLYDACSRCRGSGRQRTAESRAQAILRRLGSSLTLKGFTTVEVCAHPEVIDYLQHNCSTQIRELRESSKRDLRFRAVPDQVEDSVLHYLRADGREVRPGGRRKR